MRICSAIIKSARFLQHEGRWIYRTRKHTSFLLYWYTTRPRSIDAEGPHQQDHFDVRTLPPACLEGLDIRHIDTVTVHWGEAGIQAFRAALLVQEAAHREAISRAIAAGHLRPGAPPAFASRQAMPAPAPQVAAGSDDLPF